MRHLFGEFVGADGTQLRLVNWRAKIDLDFIGKDRTEKFPIACINRDRVAMDELADVRAIYQQL